MATVLGNAAIFLDLISHQNPALPDRKPGIHPPLPHLDPILLSLTSKRDPFSKAFETEPDRRIRRDRAVAAWGKASNDGFECKEDENESGREEWEAELKRRLKEIEEMKELEKKAEELQSRAEKERNGPGRPEEDSEEEKRMRVRKIQIWLAMAYEAHNRHADCIALYQQLEKTHPSISIRRQAKELRYILQAPKLKISQEEMVTIPLIGSSYDSYAGTWTDKYKEGEKNRSHTTTNQLPSSRDFLGDFLIWRPPVGLEKNTVFWVALTAWLGLVGAALILQR